MTFKNQFVEELLKCKEDPKEFLKYIYIKDKKSGKVKQLHYNEHELELLQKYREFKERNYGTTISKF